MTKAPTISACCDAFSSTTVKKKWFHLCVQEGGIYLTCVSKPSACKHGMCMELGMVLYNVYLKLKWCLIQGCTVKMCWKKIDLTCASNNGYQFIGLSLVSKSFCQPELWEKWFLFSQRTSEFWQPKPAFAAESGQIRKNHTFSNLQGLNLCTSHILVFGCLYGQDVVGS